MMRSSLVLGVVTLALVSACGGDDDDGGTTVDGGSTVDAAASGCQPTGGLPMQAPGGAVINATLASPAGGYNGVTTPFNTFSGAASAGNFQAFNEMPTTMDSTLRRIVFTFQPNNPTACQSIPTNAMPGQLTALTYEEGGPITSTFKKWFCTGNVIIDTVGPSTTQTPYTFHFDNMACSTFSFVMNNAMGTVKLTGKGSATNNR